MGILHEMGIVNAAPVARSAPVGRRSRARLAKLIVAALLALGCLAVFGINPARADTTVSVVPSSANVNVSGRTGFTTAHLIINNSGDATQVGIVAWSGDGQSLTLDCRRGGELNCSNITLNPRAPTAVDVRLPVDRVSTTSGTLEVVDQNGNVSTVSLSVFRTPSLASLAVALGIAFGAAVLVLLFASNFLSGAKDPLAEGADWKFSDSWASNVTTISGAAGAALSGTALASFTSGVSQTTFLVLALIFTALPAVAPIVFGLLVVDDPANINGTPTKVGTKGGFVAAGLFTIGAALGELASVGLLAWMSGLSNGALAAIIVLLAVGGVVTAWYAFVTVRTGTSGGRSYAGKGRNAPRLAALQFTPGLVGGYQAVRPPAPGSKAGVRVALL
jgi:hypothetical protein